VNALRLVLPQGIAARPLHGHTSHGLRFAAPLPGADPAIPRTFAPAAPGRIFANQPASLASMMPERRQEKWAPVFHPASQ